MRLTIQNKLIILMSLFVVVSGLWLVYARILHTKTMKTLCIGIEKEFDEKAALKGLQIKSFVNDYSYWDDLVMFIKTGNTSWANDNFDNSMAALGADAVWIHKSDGDLLYSAVTDKKISKKYFSSGGNSVDKIFKDRRFCHFFIDLPKGVMEVYGATIHPTNDIERKTQPQGFLLAGRIWTKEYLKELAYLTGSEVIIMKPGKDQVFSSSYDFNDGLVSFSRKLEGWNGEPLLMAKVSTKSETLREINQYMKRQFVAMVFVALSMLLMIYYLLVKWINKPLDLIAGSIDFDNPATINKLKNEKTEFGYMARLIIKMYEQKLQFLRDTSEWKKREVDLNKENYELLKKIEDSGTSLLPQNMNVDNTALMEEIDQLKESENKMKENYAELEKRYRERTSELHLANEGFQKEMTTVQKHHKAEIIKAIYEKKKLVQRFDDFIMKIEEQQKEIDALKELHDSSVSGWKSSDKKKDFENVGYGGR